MPLQLDRKAIVHVVDDDPSIREALQDLFLSIGLETRTYPTAGDFLATALSDTPGCLVVDIRLPDTNGLDFQVQLKKAGVRLPVVMMTGYGDITRRPTDNRRRCYRDNRARGQAAARCHDNEI